MLVPGHVQSWDLYNDSSVAAKLHMCHCFCRLLIVHALHLLLVVTNSDASAVHTCVQVALQVVPLQGGLACSHKQGNTALQQKNCTLTLQALLHPRGPVATKDIALNHDRQEKELAVCRMLGRCWQSSQSLLPSLIQPWRSMRLQVCPCTTRYILFFDALLPTKCHKC